MAAFKCKMCGGSLEITEGTTVFKCEYCGTNQTVPNADNEKKINLFNRANRLRSACEFDKAAVIYENIVSEFSEEAEAYWGLCLCKFGIEYVDDPKTAKKIPTCHRTSYSSIFDDSDFELACEYADSVALQVYRSEAKEIDRLQKEILNIAKNEEPFDIFICYKESDNNGGRTVDSELAHDLYDVLTEKGYKVFYSRITLKAKLGQDYEPYIFSALNSAKVMLAVGTKYEYYNAVWVKNEWSRFLALMGNGKEKTLIPCYKDIDAYDIPKEFSNLQGQDLSSPRAFQDLITNIERIIPPVNSSESQKETAVYQVKTANPTEDSLVKRAYSFLEDGEWDKAYEYCEKILDIDVENPHVYLCRLCADLNVHTLSGLENLNRTFENNVNYKKIMRYGDETLKNKILGYIDAIKYRNEQERQKQIKSQSYYETALKNIKNPNSVQQILSALYCFRCLDYPDDTKILSMECRRKISLIKPTIILPCNSNIKCAVGLKSDATVDVTKNEYGQYNFVDWTNIIEIGIGTDHIVGLKSNGTVVAVGSNIYGECNVSEWTDIIAIAANGYNTAGLKADGTVVVIGDNKFGQCDVSDWKDIATITAYNSDKNGHIIGIKFDGTVVAVGDNQYGQCNVYDWKEIVAVTVNDGYTVGLKSDGTVVAVGNDQYGQCDVSDWKDIVAVVAAREHTIGLKSDGTVVAVGNNQYDQCDVSTWTDIVAVAAYGEHTVGLKSDGTVVAAGNNQYDQCDVSTWTDIVAVAVSDKNTVGLKSDGTVVAVGNNQYRQCDTSNWENIAEPLTAQKKVWEAKSKVIQDDKRKKDEQERRRQEEEAEKIRQINLKYQEEEENRKKEENKRKNISIIMRKELGLCLHCGGKFKGSFKKICSVCGMPKDY